MSLIKMQGLAILANQTSRLANYSGNNSDHLILIQTIDKAFHNFNLDGPCDAF